MDGLQERTLKAYQEHYDDLLRFALTVLKDEYAAQEAGYLPSPLFIGTYIFGVKCHLVPYFLVY